MNWKQTNELREGTNNPLDTIWFMISYVIEADLHIVSQDWWEDDEAITYSSVWVALERWHVKKGLK